ncbi:putative transporter, major facilitator family protein [Trichinella nativa]|uniref:Putative transporter, major facilitator family protein n=1 Tax=Trichinella nativa TaxID=6335 RepID=A0A1Y3ELZ1_9BILA|nr:putative transporter, major facilitator family protein [Trichinella nativa]
MPAEAVQQCEHITSLLNGASYNVLEIFFLPYTCMKLRRIASQWQQLVNYLFIMQEAQSCEVVPNNRNRRKRMRVSNFSEAVKRFLLQMTIEPAIFLYTFTSYVHFPVLQAFIYEKAYITIYKNASDVWSDKEHSTEDTLPVQTLANHTFLLSTVCLLLPSLFVTAVCGSLSDIHSRKRILLFPFIGLILSDINYIIQSICMKMNIYLILLSDILFGLFGGFSSILGTMFSFCARLPAENRNSCHIATIEAFIGFGGTLGFIAAGLLHRSCSYLIIFSINTAIHVVILAYLCLRIAKHHDQITAEASENGHHASNFTRQFSNVELTMAVVVLFYHWLPFVFLIFYPAVSAQSIMFYYFKHKFDWMITEYGFFRGVYYGAGSFMVLLIYPQLKAKGLSDLILATIGLIARSLGCLCLGLSPNGWIACITLIFFMFNRFNATGLRFILSDETAVHEQGKIFAIVAMAEAIIGMLASIVFNSLFPITLTFYSGFCHILISLLFIMPLMCVFMISRFRKSSTTSRKDGTTNGENENISAKEEE